MDPDYPDPERAEASAKPIQFNGRTSVVDPYHVYKDPDPALGFDREPDPHEVVTLFNQLNLDSEPILWIYIMFIKIRI